MLKLLYLAAQEMLHIENKNKKIFLYTCIRKKKITSIDNFLKLISIYIQMKRNSAHMNMIANYRYWWLVNSVCS